MTTMVLGPGYRMNHPIGALGDVHQQRRHFLNALFLSRTSKASARCAFRVFHGRQIPRSGGEADPVTRMTITNQAARSKTS